MMGHPHRGTIHLLCTHTRTLAEHHNPIVDHAGRSEMGVEELGKLWSSGGSEHRHGKRNHRNIYFICC